ncbi:YjgP/YjgQ family permease [Ancylomarina euxinus]|uniref:YjgP/YjgQ family permease n=1 Tax=Ancylomarina euxinus TaxID=2283627 RepID=A0A425Y4Y6_9BACT|nr:LptF/LptG family permease [Ancylomarina euxinus]MCZ4694450.1 LptF/LptG family permease [Ancylomarina euxinus]MUP16651.1 LptF/LptG family permease [Ancylomarina euxinus]RRG23542.1 YjgP/YjgQ family permease [Ancylomarina euxinus]
MFGKLDLYIIRKFLGTFFFAIVLIISITIVFDFSEKIDNFIDKEAPFKSVILDYYVNFIPYFANLFSALFTFISVIYFTSKMAYDTEIIAILSSGVSFRRLMFPYFISAFIIGIFSFFLSNFVIPPANAKRLEFTDTYLKKRFENKERNIHRQIEPGLFIYMTNFETSSNTGYKFSLEKFEGKQLVSKLTSRSIKWNEDKEKWTIKDYFIRSSDGDKESFEKGKTIDTLLNFGPDEFSRRTDVVEAMDMFELDDFIEEQIMRGDSNISAYKIEKYRRIANPFSAFILTLIGVSLACRKVRGGMGLHLGIGLALSFSFILFMQISTVFATNGSMSPLLAVWLPNMVFSLIAIYLYRVAPK